MHGAYANKTIKLRVRSWVKQAIVKAKSGASCLGYLARLALKPKP